MKSNLSAKETLLYNDREKSEIIFIRNLTGENVFDVEKQMAARQKLFTGRAKNLTAHIIISPSIDDGKKQTRLDWKEIGESFLQKAGLSSYQSIAYLHKDKEHFHLHIVANRIDTNGKIYRHKNELAMSHRLSDEIAIERGLIRAAEIRRERKLAKAMGIKIDPEVGIVARMRDPATESALQAWSNGLFNQEKYFEALRAEGFRVQLFFKKESSEVRGYAIGKKGERLINASQIGSEFTLRNLMREAPGSEPVVKPSNIKVRNDIEASFQKAMTNENKFDPQLFLNELRTAGYIIHEYYNKDSGKLRGYGIEIKNKVVNASEIGSNFTLNNLSKRFKETSSFKEQRINPRSLEPETVSQAKEEVEFSKELKRTIDIQLLSSELHDLTSGHRYRSPDDFIKAIEEKGYHVHLRYDQGRLSGYTIHKGIEHYHDSEIDKGRFQLTKLIKNGDKMNASLYNAVSKNRT